MKHLISELGVDISFRAQLTSSLTATYPVSGFHELSALNWYPGNLFVYSLDNEIDLQLNWFTYQYYVRPCFYNTQFSVIYKSPIPVLNYSFQIVYWYQNLHHNLFNLHACFHLVSDERQNSILILIFVPRVHQSTDSTVTRKI